MDFSKLKNKLLFLLCVFVVIFPFCCIAGFCSESEDVDYNLIVLNDTVISQSGTINNSDGFTTYFLELEDGYSYTIDFNNQSGHDVRTGFCNSTDYQSTVYNFSYTSGSSNFVINSDDYQYFYFCFGDTSNYSDIEFTITKSINNGMINSVDSLVNNVGFDQFWNVFTNAIPMISTCAIFIFGFVIVTYLYLKLSKGKAGF